MKAYLSIKEAAEFAGVSTKTIRRYINTGTLVSKTTRGKRGMEYRILKSSLIQYFRRSGYDEPAGQEEAGPVEEGEILVRLRHLVPRYLYDELQGKYEVILVECGQWRQQALDREAEVTRLKEELAPLHTQARENLILRQRVQQLETMSTHLQRVEKHNIELMQAVAEKDRLITMLERQYRTRSPQEPW